MTQPSNFQIGDEPRPRIRYGDEPTDWGAGDRACSSCGVAAGSLHHRGCFIERCPVCEGQAMSCQCDYRESFGRRPISATRTMFYRCFYLVGLPVLLIFGVSQLLPIAIPGPVVLGLAVLVPVVLLALFWRAMDTFELNETFVVTKKDADGDRS